MPESIVFDRVINVCGLMEDNTELFNRDVWARLRDLGTADQVEVVGSSAFIVTYSSRVYQIRYFPEIFTVQENNRRAYPVQIVDGGLVWRCRKTRIMSEFGRRRYVECEAEGRLFSQ